MSEPERFVIAGTQRTGTTLLRTTLSSHPEIVCHGEVFQPDKSRHVFPGGYGAFVRLDASHRIKAALLPRYSVRDYLAQLYERRDCRAVGFKVMLSHCKVKRSLWPMIEKHDVKVILVIRRNVLKTLVSRRAAMATGVYHVSPTLQVKTAVANWKVQPIAIDTTTILRELDRISGEPAEWRRRLEHLESMEVAYEEYVRDQQFWNDRMLGFLGVPRRTLSSDLKKVNPDVLGNNLVANYEQIADVVRRSRYSFCLGSDN